MSVKNKGGLKPWTTSRQHTWLAEKLDAFQAFRNTPLAKDFWTSLFEEWFSKWPLEAPEAPGSVKELRNKKQQQIKDWLKNHSKSASATPSEGKPKLLDLQRRKAKRLPVWQAYSKLYYDSKLRDLVDDLWMHKYRKENPDAGDNDVPPPIPIAWRNETIAILFEDEPDEVKKECKKFADKTELPVEELPEGMETDDPIERKRRVEACAYGRAIKSLNVTMMTLLRDVTRQTGLIGTIILAGPNPNKGGSLTLFEYHIDKVNGVPGFLDYEGYQDLRTSFHDFACTVYPPELRLYRAIPGTETEANYIHMLRDDSVSIAERPHRNKKPIRYMSVHTSDDDSETARTRKKGKGKGKQHVKETVESSDSDNSSDEESEWTPDAISQLGTRELANQINIAYDKLAEFTAQRSRLVDAEQSSNLVVDGPPEVLLDDNIPPEASQVKNTGLHEAPSVIGTASNIPPKALLVKNTGPHEALSVINIANDEPSKALPINNAHNGGLHEACPVIHDENDEPSEASLINNTQDGGSHKALPVIDNVNDGPLDELPKTLLRNDTPDSGPHEALPVIDNVNDGPLDELPKTLLRNDTPDSGPHEALPVVDNVNDGPLEASLVKNMLVDENVNNRPPKPPLDIRNMLSEIADIKWPSWMENNLRRLWEVSGLDEYHEVVRNIAVMDMLMGFPTGQSKAVMVSKGNRPEAINRWITAGRKSWPVLELSSFVPSWKKWWVSLQPESRIGKHNTLICEVNADEAWEELMKGSVNGFFTVVVGLGMWATAVKTPVQEKGFAEMVKDVAWVQDQIIGKLKKTNKRTRTKDENEKELRRGKRARK